MLRARLEPQGLQAQLVLRARQVQQVLQELLGLQVQLGLQARLVQLVRRVRQVRLQAHQE